MRAWVLAVGLGVAGCSADITSPSPPTTNDVSVLVGAGDIGVCGSAGAIATGKLLDSQPGTIFAAGDIAYPDGSAEQFRTCYDPAWGGHKDRTRPAPGNHEYGSGGAAPYFAYFGPNAGPAGLGYYRYRIGTWVVFSLNSNTEGVGRVAQVEWLRRELDAQIAPCTVAYFHHPRFSSGSHGTIPPLPVVPDLWRELYAAGVEVVISAHEHFYERFSPQTPDGVLDLQFGLRQFIVGTGGAPLTQPVRRVANSDLTLSSFGVFRLQLEGQSYRWDFLSADGGAILDSGQGLCHGKPQGQ